ncbi:MAG: hypothetical protein AB8B74_13060 [Crocinitomicaceae bacterium]
MEKIITVNNQNDSLDKILKSLTKESSFECTQEYDIWDMRTDTNNQMEQCIVIKKSAMHGVKAYLNDEKLLKMNYIIPNKVMNAYFGKSQKRHKNIIEVITGKISQALLSGSQKKAFSEIEKVISSTVS